MALALAGALGVPASFVVETSAAAAGVPSTFRPNGVLLEQTLPRRLDAASFEVVAARDLG
jgi:hypothetical protein